MICKITNFLRIFTTEKKCKIRKILRMKKIRKIRILDQWWGGVNSVVMDMTYGGKMQCILRTVDNHFLTPCHDK